MEGNNLSIRRAVVEFSEGNGIDQVALVEDPASEVAYLFGKQELGSLERGEITEEQFQEQLITFAILEEEGKVEQFEEVPESVLEELRANRQVTGLAIQPWKPIYRIDESTGEEFYLYFTPEDIRQAFRMFTRTPVEGRFNFEHSDEIIDDLFIVGSEIVQDPENSIANFYKHRVPKGTLWLTVEFGSQESYDKYAATGGFSIETTVVEMIMNADKNND